MIVAMRFEDCFVSYIDRILYCIHTYRYSARRASKKNGAQSRVEESNARRTQLENREQQDQNTRQQDQDIRVLWREYKVLSTAKHLQTSEAIKWSLSAAAKVRRLN
jgi:hypothetical protein